MKTPNLPPRLDDLMFGPPPPNCNIKPEPQVSAPPTDESQQSPAHTQPLAVQPENLLSGSILVPFQSSLESVLSQAQPNTWLYNQIVTSPPVLASRLLVRYVPVVGMQVAYATAEVGARTSFLRRGNEALQIANSAGLESRVDDYSGLPVAMMVPKRGREKSTPKQTATLKKITKRLQPSSVRATGVNYLGR